MDLAHKLKTLERKIVYLTWGRTASYGKIEYVGSNFIEFSVIDKYRGYGEKLLINLSIIMEVVYKSSDIERLIAEISAKLPEVEEPELSLDIENKK